jgi:Zn ribbon nucleic-acid-binding protein
MPPPLAPAWLDYRTRLGVLLLAVVGLVLGAAGLSTALASLAGDETPANLLAAAWITGSVAALGWYAAFRCPHCAQPFHWTLWIANPVARACLHCGFAKWRDPDAARALAPTRSSRL